MYYLNSGVNGKNCGLHEKFCPGIERCSLVNKIVSNKLHNTVNIVLNEFDKFLDLI